MKTKEKILSKITDFRNFLYITWKHLRLPEPTTIQYDIANFLANEVLGQLLVLTGVVENHGLPQLMYCGDYY